MSKFKLNFKLFSNSISFSKFNFKNQFQNSISNLNFKIQFKFQSSKFKVQIQFQNSNSNSNSISKFKFNFKIQIQFHWPRSVTTTEITETVNGIKSTSAVIIIYTSREREPNYYNRVQ